MSDSLWFRSLLVLVAVAFTGLAGCPGPISESDRGNVTQSEVSKSPDATAEVADTPVKEKAAGRVSTAAAEDVAAAKELLDELGAQYKIVPEGVMTEVSISDGSGLQPENIALIGKLTDLESLEILNYRDLDDEMVAQLVGLKNLRTLALTNSAINDESVQLIVDSFPELKILDLSSNTNLTNSALKSICEMTGLERLMLVQTGFNDIGMIRLPRLENLKVLDIRGNVQATDTAMGAIGSMPKLQVLKHRAPVSDLGVEPLTQCKTLKSLLMQDFLITGQSGLYLSQIENLTELEIFRCQNFDSDGLLALTGMPLTRLKLRDIPVVDDRGMEVFSDLPALQKLYLHELETVSDDGLKYLENLEALQILDIWSLPQMTDATVDVIAKLPNIKELSIRATAVTDAAVDKLLEMSNVQKLTFKENGSVTPAGLEKLATGKWDQLDTGQ